MKIKCPYCNEMVEVKEGDRIRICMGLGGHKTENQIKNRRIRRKKKRWKENLKQKFVSIVALIEYLKI